MTVEFWTYSSLQTAIAQKSLDVWIIFTDVNVNLILKALYKL